MIRMTSELSELVNAAIEMGRERERKDVVAWLREIEIEEGRCPGKWDLWSVWGAIEGGQHVSASAHNERETKP